MLVLARWAHESVRIGEDITITVLGTRRDEVQLGIKAPKAIPVHRKEIYERIKREERSTAQERQESEPERSQPVPDVPR